MSHSIVLSLAHSPGNPRNSEGAFLDLADGRILFAYTRYSGESGGDASPAVIVGRESRDGGQTWSASDRVLVKNEGRCNVMSVSLARLAADRIGLFYLRKNGPTDCRTRLRISQDEGQTWRRPILCIHSPGYYVVNNDRVVRLQSGRLVLPAAQHRARTQLVTATGKWQTRTDPRAIFLCHLSDDAGKTWREAAEWWTFPGNGRNCLQEPGVVELRDGRLYGWCRTDADCQYETFSTDGGDSWTQPQPSRFQSPCSPLSIKRIPSTGDLLAVWNDHEQPAGTPREPTPPSSWQRTPLAVALSKDDGRTWSRSKLIETDMDRGFCYCAIHFTNDAVLLAYCCGGRGGRVLQDSCLRRISLPWLYA